MKRKAAFAMLLFISFSFLAYASGAIPVRFTEADAASAEQEAPEMELPSASAVPEPTESPIVTPEPTPTNSPAPTETPGPTPGVSIIATTITSADILDNDTYYNVDPDELLAGGFSLPIPAGGYQVLIIHTHATEAYAPTADDPYDTSGEYRTTDPAHSVIRVGEELAGALSAYGLSVLHDTNLYDYPSYNGSYARCGEAIERYLEAYPGIRLVIDLHRDALGDDEVIYKTLADIDGVEAAQLMFVMGTDVNFEHPDWRENLSLALTLQGAVSARYPTLMRPVVLCDSRYNQQLCPGSLLLEVGTSGNTLAEALAGVDRFAEIVGPLLASWVE